LGDGFYQGIRFLASSREFLPFATDENFSRRGLAADAEDNQKMAAALIAISTKVANP